MGIGYLLGGLACLAYMIGVGFFGGIKKSPKILKMAKDKVNKNMTDKAAARMCLIIGGIVGAAGIFLLIFGAVTHNA